MGPARPVTREQGPPTIAARFKASGLLARDRGIATWAGTDLETGVDVIIRTASSADIAVGTSLRLEQEADALRDIESPFVAAALSVGRDDDHVYVVSPCHAGVPLADRIRLAPLSTSEALVVGEGVMQGLAAAHAGGVLHRDLKPSNLIVNAEAPIERVTLVDFGSARTSPLVSIRGLAVDEACYVSPEQAGSVHQDVDERSDLYSAGVLLFECIAGHPPFVGDSIGGILRDHLTVTPPSLRACRGDVPAALDAVIQRLLRKDPADRYQSADGAYKDLCEIAQAIERGDTDPAIVVGLHDCGPRVLAEPVLVARGRELELLEHELDLAAGGARRLVLLEAESGGGKSRLLDAFARSSALRGAWVLNGQGRDQAAQRPFEVLDGVVRAVVARCESDAEFASGLRDRLAGQEEALLEAMPELAAILQAPRSVRSLGAEEHGERRSLQALAVMLNSLGSAECPALVMLDDCQWADELTLKLLAHWRVQHADRGAEPCTVLLAACRTEEVSADHDLRRLNATNVLLRPLDAGDIRALVESMAGPVPQEVLDCVTRLSRGNPFLAVELLRGLVETDAMVADENGWRVTRPLREDVQSSDRSAAVFGRRLEHAPEDVLDLLSIGAVLGKSFELSVVVELSRQSPRRAMAGLTDAGRRHIIWTDSDGDRFTFVHDKLREALLDRLSDDRRRALHGAVAGSLAKRDSSRIYELAYHFDAAGEHGQALPYALQAADAARSRFAPDVAERHYEIAARAAAEAAPEVRLKIAEGLGDVSMLRGRYDGASRHFEIARGVCRDEPAAARIEGKLGELAFKRGDVKTACELLVRALRLLGHRVPRRASGFFVMLLWEIVVQVAHSALPRRFLGRRSPEGTERERLAMRLHSRLAHAYWFRSGLVPCGWAHLRGMNMAERYPPTLELAMAYSEHAPVMTMVPWCSRGIAYAERSLVIRRAHGDVWGEGQSLNFHGVVLYAAGRFEDVVETCEAAAQILEQTGDQWEVNLAGWHVAFALYRLGRGAEAAAIAERVHRAGVAIGDRQASGISLGAWAKASDGAVPWPLIEAELEHADDDVHTRAEVLQAKGLRLLADGDVAAAVAVLADADGRVRKAGLRQEYVAPVRPWLATALRMQLESDATLSPSRRRRLARRARRCARGARRLATSYRNNLPHALREQGLLAGMGRRPRRARKLLDRSIAVAASQGALREQAQTLLARGRLGSALGWPRAADDLRAGRRMHDELEPVPTKASSSSSAAPNATLSLLDRFSTVLDAGRQIASARSKDAVFAALDEAAVTLLRGERSTVFELAEGAHAPVRAVAGDLSGDIDARLVERAVQRGGVVIRSDAELGDGAGEAGAARSALCAPIFLRGRAVACVHVTHGQLSALFGEEEERLAAFMVALAGAALENAEGFSEVRTLTVSLEQRVAERTAELSASTARAEAALSMLAATLDSTADGILVVDGQGRIANHNRRFAEMWDIPEEVLATGDYDRAIAFALRQLCDPERFLGNARELCDDIDAESHDQLELVDGRVFKRDSKPQRLGGESIGRVWSFRDVTDEARLLHEQRDRSRMLSLLQVVSAAANGATSAEAILQTCVDELCTYLDWSVGHAYLVAADGSGDLVSSGAWHVAGPGRFDAFRRATDALTLSSGVGLARAVLAGGKPVVIVDLEHDARFARAASARECGLQTGFAFPVRSGSEVVAVLEFFSAEAREPDSRLLALIDHIGTQIGRVIERARTEAALRVREEQYRALVESAFDAIVSCDVHGDVTYFNPAAERIFGYTPEEVLGESLTIIMPERFHADHVAGMRRFIDTGEARILGRTVEVVGRRKDGSEFPLEAALATWKTEAGVGFTGNLRDITERKQAQDDLAVARDQAVQASSMKSAFVATMSHEIRTPLAGVIGMSGLLLETDLSGQQREYAEAVTRSGEALLAIVDDILDFSKIEAGRLELDLIDISLLDMAKQACALMAVQAREKGLALSVEVDRDVPALLRGDGGRIRQILLNLLSNAVKFTAQGQVAARVFAKGTGPAGTLVRVEVADTGIGIDPGILERMFEPFSQADASTTRDYGGTGLGLGISRQLVELMGGEIGAESEPGHGSTFWFEVELAAGNEEHASTARELPAPRRDDRGSLDAAPVVLIADDSSVNQTVAQHLVERCGYRTELVADGRQAMRALERKQYAAVLMDCQMPEMDGYEAAAELRRRERGTANRTPIIAMTANAMSGDREKCLAAGMDAYLSKPMRADALSQALHRWIPAPTDGSRPTSLDGATPGELPALPEQTSKDRSANETRVG